ncbi:FeoA family protein [Abyssisolibacter fermentans]|uniref:FeoA family protein n=1 Tax=Abyssisolibacter fermentans TaxID=1766203 RepID=UPI0008310DC0|nr:FeoA family protein [Abyssisolibacter fermentans]
MKSKEIPLYKLAIGKTAMVKKIICDGYSRRRLLDLGITKNSTIKAERKSPSSNPIAYNIRGSIIALRNEEAKNIIVIPLNL